MSEEELDSPSHLAAAIERLRTRKAQRDNACNLARQWLRANPAALVTIQTDGTLVIVTQQGRIEVSGDLKWQVE